MFLFEYFKVNTDIIEMDSESSEEATVLENSEGGADNYAVKEVCTVYRTRGLLVRIHSYRDFSIFPQLHVISESNTEFPDSATCINISLAIEIGNLTSVAKDYLSGWISSVQEGGSGFSRNA